MKDNLKEIYKFLANIPDKFTVVEEGIDFEIQKEYASYSDSFERGELSEEKTIELGNLLFEKDAPIDKKKKVLTLLAHLGSIEAFRQIEKYHNSPDIELKQWTQLALHECKMFLETNLLEESQGLILSGLGGVGDRLRFYFFLLPLPNHSFTKAQISIIGDEFQLICKDLNSILEKVEYTDPVVGLTILIPLDVAFGTVIEAGIKKCNEYGNFVFEHYYATNGKIPELSEIGGIVKIVMEG